MSAGGWGCPHEVADRCGKVDGRPCEPGMKGCELAGRYVFFDEGKNSRRREKQAQRASVGSAAVGSRVER
jgi:hypothetical protein